MTPIHEGHTRIPLKESVCGDLKQTVGSVVFRHFPVTLELCACSGAAFAAVLERGTTDC